MNYTNYSSFFDSGDVFACTSHNDFDYSIIKNDGKAMLDLQSVLLNQILSYGVFISNVLIDSECTKCSYKKFFSYRREKEKSGRMLSIFNLMLK